MTIFDEMVAELNPQTMKTQDNVDIGMSDAEVFYRYFKADVNDIRKKVDLAPELLNDLPSGDIKVLFIFMTGSNKTPSKDFYDIEKIILEYIKTH